MVSKQNEMECSQNILAPCINKHARLSFLFSCFMIRQLAEKACKQIVPWFVSDWLEFLIHIHSNPRIVHIL